MSFSGSHEVVGSLDVKLKLELVQLTELYARGPRSVASHLQQQRNYLRISGLLSNPKGSLPAG